jgi:hypothetical protein
MWYLQGDEFRKWCEAEDADRVRRVAELGEKMRNGEPLAPPFARLEEELEAQADVDEFTWRGRRMF